MNSSRTILAISISALAFAACDREGRNFIAEPNPDFPGVQHLGEIEVLELDSFRGLENRIEVIHYGRLGAAEPGTFGGATATFTGTGGDVCVMVDPEAVFWNESVATQNPNANYSYQDTYQDDGDIDLEVGLTAYYTGSPGYEMGDFAAIYEDSLGNEVRLEFNECYMAGYGNLPDAHAGRGGVEYCTIDTSIHPGKSYTVVLNTFSVPIDDGMVDYAFAVIDGDCGDVATAIGGITECALPAEAREESEDGDPLGAPYEPFEALENAFCSNNILEFCTNNPHLCGDE